MDFNCLLARWFKYLYIKMAQLIFESALVCDNNQINIGVKVLLFKEGEVFIAYSPSLDLSACGITEEEARNEFGQTVEEYISYCVNKKTLAQDLQRHGWTVKSRKRIKAPSEKTLLELNSTYKDIKKNKEYKTIEKEILIPAI